MLFVQTNVPMPPLFMGRDQSRPPSETKRGARVTPLMRLWYTLRLAQSGDFRGVKPSAFNVALAAVSAARGHHASFWETASSGESAIVYLLFRFFKFLVFMSVENDPS